MWSHPLQTLSIFVLSSTKHHLSSNVWLQHVNFDVRSQTNGKKVSEKIFLITYFSSISLLTRNWSRNINVHYILKVRYLFHSLYQEVDGNENSWTVIREFTNLQMFISKHKKKTLIESKDPVIYSTRMKTGWSTSPVSYEFYHQDRGSSIRYGKAAFCTGFKFQLVNYQMAKINLLIKSNIGKSSVI